MVQVSVLQKVLEKKRYNEVLWLVQTEGKNSYFLEVGDMLAADFQCIQGGNYK